MTTATEQLLISRSTRDRLPEAAAADPPGFVLLVDKEQGWTSFDVVAKCRGLLRIRKIGHAGTLDPMATGLLILCVGRATKMVDQFQAEEKEYTGTIHFGATTPSDDAETPENATFPTDHLSIEQIRAAAAGFLGETMQVTPMYSARKVEGQRLYKAARRGEVVERPARPITVTTFEIEGELPNVTFRVVCSKGTYIRGLARDLGAAVGSGAYLTALRRSRSGSFRVEESLRLGEIAETLRTGRTT